MARGPAMSPQGLFKSLVVRRNSLGRLCSLESPTTFWRSLQISKGPRIFRKLPSPSESPPWSQVIPRSPLAPTREELGLLQGEGRRLGEEPACRVRAESAQAVEVERGGGPMQEEQVSGN